MPKLEVRRVLFCSARLVLIVLGMSGCKAKYPKCDSDESCISQNEVCVFGQCQECRDDTQCAQKYPTEHRVCNLGRCDVVPQPITSTPAPPEEREYAKKGTVSITCRTNNPKKPLALDPIYFEFDQYELNTGAQLSLQHNVDCLAQVSGLPIILDGHSDERGTQEYNLALGEKRADTVFKFIKTLGADVRTIVTRSKGENEPVCEQQTDNCWAQNRRVEFVQNP